ncbi:MAG: SDR family oxidoreductase [Planctomycetota bacterium]|jgi:glucose 1-dehydrogenase|nr:SDR family oxidoreductase [Planctomycetota bacterium]
MKRFDLTGRRALVTGASRGIGRAIALGLAEAGADVAVHCAGNRAAAESCVAAIAGLGRAAEVVVADLSEADAPDRIAAACGAVDILVLNASIQERAAWDQRDAAAWDRQLAVNLRSSAELIQLLAPGMCAAGWGRIVTVGSVQQVRPHPEMLAYAASKAALENLARNLARQLAPQGVTVNNLAPGVIDTDRNSAVLADAAYRERVLRVIPSGFVGAAEDCVGAALLLCSDAGRYITGTDLRVDGGMGLPG